MAIKILLVEDDQILAKLYQTKFQKEGFEIQLAYDGQEGLDKLKSFEPGLIILDLIMPKVDGFSFLERFRADPVLGKKKIPILVLSNLGQDADIKRAQELGAADYFVKADISLGQMIEKVRKYLK
ncbi:MAG: response regulator [Candidatus Harrisonbacteria bacterium]|nr:response regulator [Candidatus Harrisonbacteria bacterium]